MADLASRVQDGHTQMPVWLERLAQGFLSRCGLSSVVIDAVDVIAEYGCLELLDSKLSKELKSEYEISVVLLPTQRPSSIKGWNADGIVLMQRV